MPGWKIEGNFKEINILGRDVPLICQQQYINLQPNAVIRCLSLDGYKNHTFSIFLDPINNITAPIIHTISKVTSLKSTIYLTGRVSVDLNNDKELKTFLEFIKTIDPIDLEIERDLEENFNWFNNPNRKSIHSTKNQREVIIWEPTKDENELKLINAVNNKNLAKVSKLLASGVSPNTVVWDIKTLLMDTIYQYLRAKLERRYGDCDVFFKIISELLTYGADYAIKHPHYDQSALSIATDDKCDELVDLIMKHVKSAEFKPCEEDMVDEDWQKTVTTANEHVKRINFFQTLLNKKQEPVTVLLETPSTENNMLVATQFIQGKNTLLTETYLTSNLSNDYFKKLLKLYNQNFNAKNELSDQEQCDHFKEKLSLNNNEKITYIDVIKDNEKIVGFNLYEIYEGKFKNHAYQVVYCSLAYVDKDYRGTRAMSLLSFRAAHALALTYPDRETYIFYDAIHPSSFRLPRDMEKLYPIYRTKESLEFVKHIMSSIYGEAKAKLFDGIIEFYFPTDSRVIGNPVDPKNYDLPCVIDQFDKITLGKNGVPGKGGVPVLWPITKNNFKMMAKNIDTKCNNSVFESHVKAFAKILYQQDIIEDIDDIDNMATCLLPNTRLR